MFEFSNKDVLVIGLGGRGVAACELLARQGARVVGVDSADADDLRAGAARLRPLGVEVSLGISTLPRRQFSLAVVSRGVAASTPLMQTLLERKVPVIGEMELGVQQSSCLAIAIAGTNGKGTTAGLIERALSSNSRKTARCGHQGRPICSVVEQSRELDFLILQVNSFQLELTRSFHPTVAVLMNLTPDHPGRYPGMDQYVQANARLFRNQEPFDWAIVQSEALSRLRELDLPVSAKTITFSACDPAADLYLDRGLLISRLANWSGPLLDLDHCLLRGPHNAENLMAALAVGHVLRLPLESMADSLKTFSAGPHRGQLVSEINGVQFINDSKASNLNALHNALLAARPGANAQPNVCLVAGGHDPCREFHDLGPLLSARVKRAFLFGEAREKIRAAWSLFTPCTVAHSLLEAITEAARSATSGDVVLFSPACSSFNQFRNYQEHGEIFCCAVESIGRGAQAGNPNIHGTMLKN